MNNITLKDVLKYIEESDEENRQLIKRHIEFLEPSYEPFTPEAPKFLPTQTSKISTPKKHLPSRAVQIQVMSYAPSVNNGQCHSLFALCEDGTIWQQWHSLESANVPQDGLWR